MKLKSIKLAGFKTFVDPTKIPLGSNLVAIVGPNGCGKSNIIDAIRWVMGESSAKQLRGEAVTDIIFNGSSVRKPVGHAAIELLFDNSTGSLGGEYAQYAEIAIRRQVSRDGQSNYYLNGTRCRRRDIIDIFLGTGLGPRSYAIIEQGTISKLIEAKPDDLRTHIEEAAGISKYKERRRETELRMQHTKDNLQRINDVRDEVGKQLERLQKQAKAAEQYKELKRQERLLKAKLLGKRWHLLAEELANHDQQIRQQELALEAEQTQYYQQEKQLIELQALHYTHAEQVTQLEQENYLKKSEINRLEQAIQHQQQRILQLSNDINQASQSLISLQNHKQEDEQQIEALTHQLIDIEPQLQQAKLNEAQLQTKLSEAEQAQQYRQSLWDSHVMETARHTQEAQTQQTKIQHIELTWQNNEPRITKFHEELGNMDDSVLQAQIMQLQQQKEEYVNKQQCLSNQMAHTQAQINEQHISYQQATKDLHTGQQVLQRLMAQHSALQTLQQEALGKKHNQVEQWLKEHRVQDTKRLAENIRVVEGWEKAVEIVLNQRLKAIGTHEIKTLTDSITQLEQGSITVIDLSFQANSTSKANLLISKIQSAWPITPLLAGIYIAESLALAWEQCETLAEHESIITQDGIWLGKGWLQIQHQMDTTTGILAREKELRQTLLEIETAQQSLTQFEQLSQTAQASLAELEYTREQIQQQISDDKSHTVQLTAQIQIKQAKLQQLQQRSKELTQEIAELQQQQNRLQLELQVVRKAWQIALENMAVYQQQQVDLKAAKEASAINYQAINQEVRKNHEQIQLLSSRCQTYTAQLDSKRQHLLRTESQLIQQQQRCELLQQQQLETEAPLIELNHDLQRNCQIQLNIAQRLAEARNSLQEIDKTIKIAEKNKFIIEQKLQKLRVKLEELKIHKQSFLVRKDTLVEQLSENGYQLMDILALLTENDNTNQFETEIHQLNQRLQRLGAINLAAIEEYQTEAERKQYLDTQYDDLVAALTALQEAIRKIDQETRHRFQETFMQINQGLQRLFPTLFGGGQAYLELTEDDLLAAGVNIMARPPGKRNSTIHLLSGGEKALTAVALVFAIFQLNPAPFCLLDEVDAPLDDANVGRFCNLLTTMAAKVQFLFITHNKVTMETAEQLIGVTMREPGVSKLVAVDIAEALKMATA